MKTLKNIIRYVPFSESFDIVYDQINDKVYDQIDKKTYDLIHRQINAEIIFLVETKLHNL